MNVSIERLRVWLLVGAGLLVLVIVSFLGYAHYRAHRFLTDLPKKLGVNVRRETNGFTYSQSMEGRTIYTIHAAKAVERADGKVTLHDVGIVLYGRKEDRADRIYGKEFEYDQKNEIIRADGEVHIDLQAPEAADANAKMDYAAGKDLHATGKDLHKEDAGEKKDVRLIHVTTSGLVFSQKQGVAATDNEIEFESGGLTGHAVGADYNSDTGAVVLHSAVKVNGLQRDRPVVLTASRAVLDRQNERALLTQAKYVAVGGKGGAGESVQARNVVAHLRPDGTIERIEAEGDVKLANGFGSTAEAPRGEMRLNAQSQPESAVLLGGVKYLADEPLRQATGEAAEGRAAFDKAGRPEHVVMTGAVHLVERVKTTGEAWGEREFNAGQMELALSSDRAGKAQLQDAKATGNARLKVTNPAVKGGGITSSALAGDVLTAHFVRVGNADHLAEVHGDGHTSMRRVTGKGVVETSSGDSLVAHFHPVTADVARASDGAAKGQGADEISTASEQGHVVMTELPVKKPGDSAAPVEERVTAERAVYDGELERTTLTGNVQVSDGASVLWADRVVSEQKTGDATADGSVKASFIQAGSNAEPVHVLAARAELKHDSQVAKFYGVTGRPARLWQGASQVDAPVIEFEQKQKRLLAHGEGTGAPGAVHTVLVSGGPGVKPEATKAGKQASGGKTSVVRVVSRDLVYSDEARRADFTGGVQVDGADGSMRGQQAIIYLQAAKTAATDGGGSTNGVKKTDAAGEGFMGGSVERVVASGHIEIQQPGRRASGEQLIYTASDGMFVLTGTAKVLPKVMDDQRGTVTGTSLQFHAGDENVVVSNEGESGQRVRTETRVKNK